jgi:ABC-type lipoprotein export system ATPase subunit
MRIQNVSFSFNQICDNYFFKNLAIDFVPAAVNFILGENGIGKSTLFSILRGVHSPGTQLSGSVELDSVVYTAEDNQLPAAFTQHVHMVHQQYDTMLASECTFKENLQLAAMPRYPRLAPLPSPEFPAIFAPLFEQVLKQFGIDADKPVYQLSGGQRQLLAILMALQKPTKLLLLDEPTATLDNANARLIMDLLQQLAHQLSITILVICHDTALVKQYARVRTCVMLHRDENGRREINQIDV